MTEKATVLFIYQTAAINNTTTPNQKLFSQKKMTQQCYRTFGRAEVFSLFTKTGSMSLKGRKSISPHSHTMDSLALAEYVIPFK